jgi:cobalamin biosynthesis Mg chelatase CobN
MDASTGGNLRHRGCHAPDHPVSAYPLATDSNCVESDGAPNTMAGAETQPERLSNPAAAAAARAAKARQRTFEQSHSISSTDAAAAGFTAVATESGAGSSAAPLSKGGVRHGEDIPIIRRKRALEAAERAVKAFNSHVVQVSMSTLFGEANLCDPTLQLTQRTIEKPCADARSCLQPYLMLFPVGS